MSEKGYRPADAVRNDDAAMFHPIRTLEEIRLEMAKRGHKITVQGIHFTLKVAEAKLARKLRELR